MVEQIPDHTIREFTEWELIGLQTALNAAMPPLLKLAKVRGIWDISKITSEEQRHARVSDLTECSVFLQELADALTGDDIPPEGVN